MRRINYFLLLIFQPILFLLAYLKYRSFDTLQDLPYYYQVLWNTVNGRFFFTTLHLPAGYVAFANHMSFTLALLVPLFWLWQSPAALLFFQSLALVAAAVPVYWLAREKIGEGAAIVISLAYIFHPNVWYSNLNDFHVTSMAAAFASFSFYYCYKRDYRKFLVFLMLLVLTKEDIILMGPAFGLYLFFANKEKKLGPSIVIASLLYFIIVSLLLFPYFGGDLFMSTQHYLATRYPYLGRELLSHPGILIENVLTPQKILYVITLLLPTLFLPLFDLSFVIVSPILAINLLSTYRLQYAITTQYSTVMVPIFYMSAVFAVEKISKNLKISQKMVTGLYIGIFLASLTSNIFYGPPPQGLVWKLDLLQEESSYKHISFYKSVRDERMEDILRNIPASSSVVASSNILPHIPARERMYQLQFVDYDFIEENKIDYILIDTENYFSKRFPQIYLNKYENLRDSPNYNFENVDGFFVFKRKT